MINVGSVLIDPNGYFYETGAVARYVQFDGSFEQAMPFVISINMQRRHLSTSQRAMIAGRLATLEWGRPIKGAKLPLSSISDVAVFAKVAERTVKHARIVLMQATPEVIARVAPRTVIEWRALSARGQAAHLDYRNSKATLNRQQDGEDPDDEMIETPPEVQLMLGFNPAL